MSGLIIIPAYNEEDNIAKKIEDLLGKKANIEYAEDNRIGDHVWYISDVSRFKSHYPEWEFTYDTDRILDELCANVRT